MENWYKWQNYSAAKFLNGKLDRLGGIVSDRPRSLQQASD
jgi:hypothetical protein